MAKRTTTSTRSRHGFTLVELLIVLFIIALLMSLLVPSLSKAQQKARAVQCLSNLRQCGISLLMYAQDNRGWVFPVGPWQPLPLPGQFMSLGTNVPPPQRWPVYVFSGLPGPDGTVYPPGGDYSDADAKRWTPQEMLCPEDDMPRADHSYIVNKHLVRQQGKVVRFGTTGLRISSSKIIVMGEKVSHRADYYMETNLSTATLSEYSDVVEQRRHGIKNGSNYLFLDWHAEPLQAAEAQEGLDPWDIPAAPPPPPPP